MRTAGRVDMGYNLKHPKIAESITDLIGRTPMLRLNKVTAGSKAEVSISIPMCLCVREKECVSRCVCVCVCVCAYITVLILGCDVQSIYMYALCNPYTLVHVI